ncbi:Saccharolysin 3 [Colletotrichum chlorophyti]|uniref:Saccharolysin 3 n=1 Tax=Colletotrichum chlorophyti TaxID=708187 RepID=A0A1Q8S3W5_9PEZI|nr:Saccharolysin 3 [Colletotrichum chlorophyti]
MDLKSNIHFVNAFQDDFTTPPQATPTSPDLHCNAFFNHSRHQPPPLNRLLSTAREAQSSITNSLSPPAATFANVLLPLAHAENALAEHSTLLLFYSAVSPSQEVRDASSEARNALRDFQLQANMDEALFNLVDAVAQDPPPLDPEPQNYLVKKHKELIKNGLRIPQGPQRDRFKHIRNRIDTLKSQFARNLAEDNTGLWFHPDDLDGLPAHLLARLEKGAPGTEHQDRVRARIPRDLAPLLRSVKNPDTRRRARLAFDNRCAANVPVFREAILLRHEAALLLGYPSHAALSIEDKMAGTPGRVDAFLASLRSRLAEDGRREAEKYLQLKKRDVESRGEAFDGRYFIWDVPFYNNLLMQEGYSVDQERIAEYFPLQTTVAGMLRIFERLFGLVFHEIVGQDRDELSPTGNGGDLVWHGDVQVFAAWDAESEGGGFLGYLYLDLTHRDGKYGNPANFSLVPGFTRQDGTRAYPSTALICAFPPSSPSKPTLLRHSDVVLLFHELGHGIHDLVSRTAFARFHGPMGTVVDFGEAPSQMLENWCWTPSQLSGLGRHYSYLSPEYLQRWQEGKTNETQPPERLPEEMVEGLIEARHVGETLASLQQLMIGVFDMAVHQLETQEKVEELNLPALWNKTRRAMVPTDDPSVTGEGDEWGHGFTNMSFLMDEYDAGFYGYFFSKVYAQDIFATVFEMDPMSVETGRRYRYGVLEKGGSQPEIKTLGEFLGREVRMEPFY